MARPSVAAWFGLALVATFMYAGPVFHAGWYYDDWSLFSAMQDASSRWWPDLFEACRSVDPAGRPGGCIYHATTYMALGDHIKLYHALSIALLIISAGVLYQVLSACRLPRAAAFAAAVLFVVYPGSDATRLWPTSVGAQYILAAYLLGVLFAIVALRSSGRRAIALHALSFALFLLMVFTYEVVLPLIAIDAIFYIAALGWQRRALVRGAADLLFALVFVVYRTVISPVREGTGFVVDRTTGQTLDRVEVVVRGAWRSWHSLFLPSALAIAIAIAAFAIVALAALTRPQVRRPLLLWLVVAGLAVVFAGAAVVSFIPANDLYIPQTGGAFNRLNMASAPAYCVFFVALAALLFHALRGWLDGRTAGEVVVALGLAVAIGQIGVARDSQAAWASSWSEQVKAINTTKRILRDHPIPRNASIVGFGVPIWERGYVPVFASGWDLRGAIDYNTDVDPPDAFPFVPSAECGTRAVRLDGVDYISYRGRSPVYFLNPAAFQLRRIESRAACEQAVADWGRPPFFGATAASPAG